MPGNGHNFNNDSRRATFSPHREYTTGYNWGPRAFQPTSAENDSPYLDISIQHFRDPEPGFYGTGNFIRGAGEDAPNFSFPGSTDEALSTFRRDVHRASPRGSSSVVLRPAVNKGYDQVMPSAERSGPMNNSEARASPWAPWNTQHPSTMHLPMYISPPVPPAHGFDFRIAIDSGSQLGYTPYDNTNTQNGQQTTLGSSGTFLNRTLHTSQSSRSTLNSIEEQRMQDTDVTIPISTQVLLERQSPTYPQATKRVYYCDVPGCTGTATRPADITRHKKQKHPLPGELAFHCLRCSFFHTRKDKVVDHGKATGHRDPPNQVPY
ncbi:hypothetical protein MBLNU230_g3764t1 [Neophaeotheca triangularis]